MYREQIIAYTLLHCVDEDQKSLPIMDGVPLGPKNLTYPLVKRCIKCSYPTEGHEGNLIFRLPSVSCRDGVQGLPGPSGPQGPAEPTIGGAIYTKWGKSSCPQVKGTELILYSGGTFYGV